MKTSAIVLTGALLAVTPAAAHADSGGYVSAGVGTAPNLGGDLSVLETSDTSSGRVAVGGGIGLLSIEGTLGGFGVQGVSPRGTPVDGTAYSLGVSARAGLPLFLTLGVYGRGGIEHTWLTGDMRDLSGNGYVLGAGFELGIPGVFVDSALWLEADRQFLTLEEETMGENDGTADLIMLGLRVGM